MVCEKHKPVAVKAEPVDSATGAERKGITCFINNPSKSICPRDPCEAVFRAMAAMDQVSEVPL